MEGPCAQTKQLIIQHVGEPRERMPVLEKSRVESPGGVFQSQSHLDSQVLRDIARVIVADEVKPPDRPINGNRQSQERQANPEVLPALALSGVSFGHHGLCSW